MLESLWLNNKIKSGEEGDNKNDSETNENNNEAENNGNCVEEESLSSI